MKVHKPTDKELEILHILWQNGPSTVREVNDRHNTQKAVGYTTTLKFMQIMHEKGLLSRTKDGKTHVYRALVSQETTQRQLLDKMVDSVFGGSAKNLVLQALGNKKSSKKELEEIRKYLDELEGGEQ